MIPEYEKNIKYISMKLDENERSNTSRLMKVKDMMLAEQIQKAEERRLNERLNKKLPKEKTTDSLCRSHLDCGTDCLRM